MSNQQELLDYLRGLPRKWLSTKEIHKIYQEEYGILNYKCISRIMSKLYNWDLLERKKDKGQKHGYLYRLVIEK